MTSTDTNIRKAKVKIKIGASIGQDFRFMNWPQCFAPGGGDYWDPNTIFEIEEPGMFSRKDYVSVRAHGFGIIGGGDGSYGCGSIHVNPADLIWVEGQFDAAGDGI